MTEDNKKKNIHEELARAAECIREADLLFENSMYVGAVSRLYYYVFHAVRALLLVESLEPKSHEGALRLLSMHFVKTGTIDPQTVHIFTRLMKYRGEADYNPSYVFTSQDYQDFRNQAVALFQRIEETLSQQGYA